jgi:hypothetical protein
MLKLVFSRPWPGLGQLFRIGALIGCCPMLRHIRLHLLLSTYLLRLYCERIADFHHLPLNLSAELAAWKESTPQNRHLAPRNDLPLQAAFEIIFRDALF